MQNEFDRRGISVDQVGITGLRYPVAFDDGEVQQSAIADFTVTVRLQPERRGTHMSRMVALVHEHLQVLDPRRLPQVLKIGMDELEAPSIEITAGFSLTRTVTAPASHRESITVHDVAIIASLDDASCAVTSAVRSEVTSLCPCSKTISDYGAHNQRSQITLAVQGTADDPYPLPARTALDLLDGTGSAPVIPLVKRSDERVLTMQAYDHPAFVEDMAREVAGACRSRGLAHEVRVRNFESIHSHDAVATINGGASRGWL
ncbi:GTP cyclohydrolase I type 2 [Actinokineospora spheciospongiae]|uniref:GTP cyclohydrolase I type 2 n=1 Tax=Actinokineospora spheciospongiae TaxID=909613 RepID=W7IJZ9_9PSEU|nr:GTP cyclohydrolase I type 2 [Actinokineospora spheciospongiae]